MCLTEIVCILLKQEPFTQLVYREVHINEVKEGGDLLFFNPYILSSTAILLCQKIEANADCLIAQKAATLTPQARRKNVALFCKVAK